MAEPGIFFPGRQKHRYLIVLAMLGDGTWPPPTIDNRFSAISLPLEPLFLNLQNRLT
jgi:hypothetical protein